MIRIFIIFFVFCFSSVQAGKIVYLIAMPRSGSTAFMRMMEASQQFYILHEPSIYAFITKDPEGKKITEGWFTDKYLKTFDEVREHIIEKGKSGNVFVKEICFFVEDFILNNDAFVSHPDIQFVFLIRNPHDSIISYYKKFFTIIPDFSKNIGCASSWSIYRGIADKVKNPIIIISAEELSQNPQKLVEKLFQDLSLPFNESYLHWEDLGDSFTGENTWHEVKLPEKIYYWHERAIHSTGFFPMTKNHIDSRGNPTFEEITDPIHRQACFKIYEENYPSYLELMNFTHCDKSN